MTEMICITCPMGCHLSIERLSESDIAVTGNRCARGEQYAREEMLSPRRVVTATCKIAPSSIAAASVAPTAALLDAVAADLSRPRRVPLRTKAAFPRERIPELLKLMYGLELRLPVQRGQVAIADALGTGIDVIVTRAM
ncbi:MAG: DUF1667 domain-containing protein [Spirochaetales bacterium]